MTNGLLLLSGNDIPFVEAQVTIHQPTVKEIAYIGEDNFYTGCGVLNFSQNALTETDRINLGNKTNFEILMSMMNENHPAMQKSKVCALMVLALIFPDYEISLNRKEIQLIKEGEIHSINNRNFEIFKEIITEMFCLKGRGDEPTEYNPGGKLAKDIAEKFNKRRQKLAEQKKDEATNISVLGHLSSIIAIGLKLDLNTVLNYTVYQLFDQYDRFDLKEQFDIHLKAQLAGARDLDDVDNWRKNIHP